MFSMSRFDELMVQFRNEVDEQLILNMCFLLTNLAYLRFLNLNSEDQWFKDKRKSLYELLFYLKKNKPSLRNFVVRCQRILGRIPGRLSLTGQTRNPRSGTVQQPAMNPNSLQDRIFSLQHHPTIADTLARNGFYCSGNNNSATCYRCGFQISNIRMAHFVHPCGNGIADLANIPSSLHENFLKHLDLTRESERIQTFEDWPSETPSVSPTALARSGFFYLGNLDRVQCFSCGGALKNWQLGDNVQTEHRRHFSHCKMSKDSEMRNVPLATDEQATVSSQHTEGPPDLSEDEAEVLRESFPCQEPANPHMRNETNRLQTFNQEWGDAQVDATSSELTKAGFFYLGSRDQVKCWYCNGGLRNWEPDQEPWAEHAKWYPSCEFLLRHKGPNFVHRIVAQFPNLRRPVMQTNSNTPRPLTQMINYPIVQSGSRQEFLASLNLANETDRLQTFLGWEQTSHPAALAKSGFFYLGNLDRVKCFSCNGVLRNWHQGDNVQTEHRRHFPHCKMCQGTEARNVPLLPDEQGVSSQQTAFHQPPDPSGDEARNLHNMFPCQDPINPHMRNEDTRFETFNHLWPAHRINATPRQMAAAGFYFLGNRDRVKCWYCNGGLQNWESQDDPWTEHAKYYPSCEFVLQRKGLELSQGLLSMFPFLARPDITRQSSNNRNKGCNRATILQKSLKFMNSSIARQLTTLGFQKHAIYQAVERRIRQGGALTLDDILDELVSNNIGTPDSTPTDKVSALEDEVKELRDERQCKVCLDREANVVFVPCGHLCCCHSCVQTLQSSAQSQNCPMCRTRIEKAIRTYI